MPAHSENPHLVGNYKAVFAENFLTRDGNKLAHEPKFVMNLAQLVWSYLTWTAPKPPCFLWSFIQLMGAVCKPGTLYWWISFQGNRGRTSAAILHPWKHQKRPSKTWMAALAANKTAPILLFGSRRDVYPQLTDSCFHFHFASDGERGKGVAQIWWL